MGAPGYEPKFGGIYSYVKNTQVFVCPDDSKGRYNGNSYSVSLISISNCIDPGYSGRNSLGSNSNFSVLRNKFYSGIFFNFRQRSL